MGNYSEEREESTAETERISLSAQQQTSHLFREKILFQTDKGGSVGLTIKYQPDSLQTIETSFLLEKDPGHKKETCTIAIITRLQMSTSKNKTIRKIRLQRMGCKLPEKNSAAKDRNCNW